ncbi:hypothetical protein JW905_08025 [bacterium]|nr:hypothetical protein [candidate division CSSED10-310 bacterium]
MAPNKITEKPESNTQTINIPTGKIGVMKEFLQFLKETKKWWIAPILLFFLLLGVLIILTEGSTVAPLIYTIF